MIVPSAVLILETIKAVAEAIIAICGLMMTEHGKKLIDEGMADRAAARKFFGGIGDWFKDLFTGELFRRLQPPPA